jgi:hypothetical protein
MADNLKAAAFQAGLSASEKKKVDDLSKALAVHQGLLNLPASVAQQKFNQYSPAQQEDLKNK